MKRTEPKKKKNNNNGKKWKISALLYTFKGNILAVVVVAVVCFHMTCMSTGE